MDGVGKRQDKDREKTGKGQSANRHKKLPPQQRHRFQKSANQQTIVGYNALANLFEKEKHLTTISQQHRRLGIISL